MGLRHLPAISIPEAGEVGLAGRSFEHSFTGPFGAVVIVNRKLLYAGMVILSAQIHGGGSDAETSSSNTSANVYD